MDGGNSPQTKNEHIAGLKRCMNVKNVLRAI